MTCQDKAFKLGIVTKTVNFKDKKDSEIISSIVSSHGLSKTVAATTFKHPNMVQYNVSDWDFILDRAKANGMIVTCDAGKLEISAPASSGTAVLDLDYGSNIISIDAEMRSDSQLKGATYQAWSSSTQKIAKGVGAEASTPAHGNIKSSALFKDTGKPELLISTSTAEDASVLKSMADSEMLFSRFSKIKGTVSFVGSTKPIPGKLIKLDGFGARFNGTAFISGVSHEVKGGFWKTIVKIGLEYNTLANTYLNQKNKALGKVHALPGLHIGKVKKIDKDPDGEF